MAVRVEKDTGDLVIDGWEQGIANSPHKGIANMQNVNTTPEEGEVMASFNRILQSQTSITNGTLTASTGDGAIKLAAPSSLQAGQWITISSSTIASATALANYLVVGGGGGAAGGNTSLASGGGGGGGVNSGTWTPSVGALSVTVGAGGAGGASGGNTGANGGDSYIGSPITTFWTLVLGGGGGGGSVATTAAAAAGAGGAGQLKEVNGHYLPSGSYTITVGSGGNGAASGTGAVGSNGSNSSIGSTIISLGGGGGGGFSSGVLSASNGGSGGGGAGQASGIFGVGGSGLSGIDGGSGEGNSGTSARSGGGGGGAGGKGSDGTSGAGGTGGSGIASTISGSSVTYAAGGTGGFSGSPGNGSAGTTNRGNGGNGGASATSTANTGGNGGSGIVIIRFPTAAITVSDSTGATQTTSGSDTILTWTSSGSFAFTYVSIVGAYAYGGGKGASPSLEETGGDGGSGGGGSSGTFTNGGSGTLNQGNAGGTGTASSPAGGGGGGAGAVGTNSSSGAGGAGGNGTASSISGSSVTYGGGGGGGGSASSGAAGTGGGGAGSIAATGTSGTNGLGGGGGGTYGTHAGGSGGSGVVIISYTTGSMTATGGQITFSGGNTIHTFYASGTFTVQSITTGTYFVSYKDSSNKIKLSSIFDPYGLYPIAHGTSGTATFSTVTTPNQAISKATEQYESATATYYRYYMLDANGYVWVYDTQVYASTLAANGVGEMWMLPDSTSYSSDSFNSIAILNGWLLALNNQTIYGKSVVNLGGSFTALDNVQFNNPLGNHKNFAYVGHQGKMYYCDSDYIGQLFPNTSLISGLANVQTLCLFSATSTTGTVSITVDGSMPYAQLTGGGTGIVPIVFFSTQTTGVPAGITEGTVYYAKRTGNFTFQVYTAQSNGSPTGNPISIITGGSYFNSFYPFGADAGVSGTHALVDWEPQRLNLPEFEIAQCMVEIGNTVLVGGITNTVYPWNQIDALPSDLILLPEANVKTMVNVNNMAYIFAGNRGNIYISNGSVASKVMKVPDYCAGVPGSIQTYVEPIFTWGDAAYLRGRVYFSILDQTAAKAGNCGGIWSFVPTQNMYIGEDVGISLRLEAQNSSGTYSGQASIIIPAQEQNVIGPQYWTSWQNSYSQAVSTTFGIDGSDTVPATTYIVETDLIPTGTMLKKKTFAQQEYKVSTPLQSGESIQLYYRLNSTDAWTSCGTVVQEPTNQLSGYFTANFQNTQWTQLRAVVTTSANSSSSFGRLVQLRLR